MAFLESLENSIYTLFKHAKVTITLLLKGNLYLYILSKYDGSKYIHSVQPVEIFSNLYFYELSQPVLHREKFIIDETQILT